MKTKLILLVIVSIIVTILILSCETSTESKVDLLTKDKISGYVQKGPFINGSSISIYELDENLSQTGNVFNTQISDNKGTFEISDIELISNYVNFRADGFYFNEIIGEQSASQITFYALSDVSDKNNINVNILTHLEKARVEYLVSNESSFNDTKIQAQKEILSIFNIEKEDINSSENLDITVQGDDNAILLAVSLILQGFHSEGELTELLSNISTDIREDGKLNSSTIGSDLINHAVYLDTTTIRNNLEKRYSDLGVVPEIDHFEKYINNFITNTSFTITESIIEYPSSGLYGNNILSLNDTIYSGEDFSLAAYLQKGTSLKIKINALESGIWYYAGGTNWAITIFDFNTMSQTFTAIESGKYCDLQTYFDAGRYLIEYYEIASSDIPTRTKTITKKGSEPPDTSQVGSSSWVFHPILPCPRVLD